MCKYLELPLEKCSPLKGEMGISKVTASLCLIQLNPSKFNGGVFLCWLTMAVWSSDAACLINLLHNVTQGHLR